MSANYLWGYILLSESRLEEKEVNKNNLRIASERFNELFVLMKDNITM